ncbi:MAG: M20/M25/M40 family metallo-hydrolase [Pseudomonadales bacterium]
MRRIIQLLFFILPISVFAEDDVPPELQRLSAAVRIPTISHEDPAKMDPKHFEEFRRFLRQSYPRVFSTLEVTEIATHSLLLKWQGSEVDLRPVLVDAHYDVVPIEPGTEVDWNFEPFSGAVEEGYLLGRGSVDNKSPVMATFEALETLLSEGYVPERTIYYSLGHDEEIGGRNGAAKIAEHLSEQGVTFEYMLAEGGLVVDSHPMLPGTQVVMANLAQKGFLTLTLSTIGEGGHSSSPTADNSLVRLAEAVSKLHRNPFEPKLVAPVSDMLAAIGEHSEGFMGFMLRNQWLTAPLLVNQLAEDRLTGAMVKTTTAVTMFNAGVKDNVIPQRAEAKVNFRLLPGDSKGSVIDAVKKIIDDPRVEVASGSWEVIPRIGDIEGPGYNRLQEAVREGLPEAVMIPGLLIATTDSRHYEDLCDNVYHFQPMFVSIDDAGGIHGTNERIRVDHYLQSVEFARVTIRKITTQ